MSTLTVQPSRDPAAASFSVEELCTLLRVGPCAIPSLAQDNHIGLRLPSRHGYIPTLADVRVVWIQRGLTGNTELLTTLRAKHPPQQVSHLWKAQALGGILRVLGR